MSDLTRRVLDADTRLTRILGPIQSQSDLWDDAVMELLDAAPILARQVEAVESELAEAEEWLKREGWDAPYEHGMNEMVHRIRHALDSAEKEADR